MLKESCKQKIQIKNSFYKHTRMLSTTFLRNLLVQVCLSKQRSLSPSSPLDSMYGVFQMVLVLKIIEPKHLITKRYSIEACLVNSYVKAVKYRRQKPSKCRAALLRCKVDVSRFLPCVINFRATKILIFVAS